MFRTFIALGILVFNLYSASNEGYDLCLQKITDSKSIHNQTVQVPVTKHQRLVFSTSVPSTFKIIKSNPFLSLYLVEDTKGFPYPFTFTSKDILEIASFTNKTVTAMKITKNQVGLNQFAQANKALVSPALINGICCSLEGVVTSKGIIQKEYLQRFIQAKNSDYSDIGVRVKDEKGSVVVVLSDPFMENNKFQKGDVILAYDQQNVKDASSFMKKVLFADVGSKHSVKIKRNSEVMTFFLQTKKRFGGGYVSDTFLEQKGIFFNANLEITKIEKNFKNYGLHVGDRLMQVNGIKVTNQENLIKHIATVKDLSSLLFERNKFQFFVQIN